MDFLTIDYDFPNQKVSSSEKEKPEFYANCIDYIIAMGQQLRDSENLVKKYDMLDGVIKDEDYSKQLNPYNAIKAEYTRFPATLRNYDLFKGIIRRYVSEYIRNPHEFMVGSNNANVVLAKNSKLQQELAEIVEQQIAARIQASYQQYIEEGGEPEQFNPEESIDIEAFVEKFNEDYIDDISAQGQELLNVIKDITEDEFFYAQCYFNYVAFGECYSYTDIIGEKIIKEVIHPLNAFPINTNNMFKEDDDMFARREKLSYHQIIERYGDYLDDKQTEFLEKYYHNGISSPTTAEYSFDTYEKYFPDLCNKFSTTNKEIFKVDKSLLRDYPNGLYDVWHVNWKGYTKEVIVTYITESGFIDQRVELEGYKINKQAGDISIEIVYTPMIYEGVRIGGRTDAIYPYKCRAVPYNRNKLSYNGINELLPGYGKFSIIETVAPYQIFSNIVHYQREMVISKNRLSILLIAKSLLGTQSEDTIYKMLATDTLYIDDTNDHAMLRAQQVRMLNASNSEYISQLTQLISDIETTAKNQADMTPQRYGEIANSAGKGVTEEAIVRGSMGSVIVEFVMDMFRERDYSRDLDYSKLAWIDGLNTSFRDGNSELKYVSLNVDSHIYADYVIKARNSFKEREKHEQLQQYAFSAAQNGDNMLAIAAITGDNIASISKLIKKYEKEKQEHELQIQESQKELQKMQEEFEITKIQVKGEEDRKLAELEGLIDAEIQLIKADANMISFDNGVSESNKQAGLERLEASRREVDREKIKLDREKSVMEMYNRFEERKVKEKEIDTKLAIAKENKNRYDFAPYKNNKKK